MGVNEEEHSGQSDACKRNPMPGDKGDDARGSNFLMIALIISAIGLLLAIGFI